MGGRGEEVAFVEPDAELDGDEPEEEHHEGREQHHLDDGRTVVAAEQLTHPARYSTHHDRGYQPNLRLLATDIANISRNLLGFCVDSLGNQS